MPRPPIEFPPVIGLEPKAAAVNVAIIITVQCLCGGENSLLVVPWTTTGVAYSATCPDCRSMHRLTKIHYDRQRDQAQIDVQLGSKAPDVILANSRMLDVGKRNS